MKVLELPAGTEPGSPEAVAFIEKQVLAPVPAAPAPEPAAALPGAYDLIIAGLEMTLDGFKELNNA